MSLKHDHVVGIVLSSLSTVVSMFYILGTIVAVTWKIPRLSVEQTRSLMSPHRRMMLITFLLSLVLVDFMTVHAWRILRGDGACVPPPDWFMLWSMGNQLSAICLITAWLHPPYALAMIHTSVISSTLLVLFYLFTTLARNKFCGSMFVVIPSMVTGLCNVFAVPAPLRLSIDEFESLPQVVGRTLVSLTRGAVATDNDSLRVYLNVDDASEYRSKDEFASVALDDSSTPRRSSRRRSSRRRQSRATLNKKRASSSLGRGPRASMQVARKRRWRASDYRKIHHQRNPDTDDFVSTSAFAEDNSSCDDDESMYHSRSHPQQFSIANSSSEEDVSSSPDSQV